MREGAPHPPAKSGVRDRLLGSLTPPMKRGEIPEKPLPISITNIRDKVTGGNELFDANELQFVLMIAGLPEHGDGS